MSKLLQTGIVYDERMLEHKSLWEDHPERPERYTSILKRCRELGLLDRCKLLPARSADEAEILTKHSAAQVKTLRDLCEQNADANEDNYAGLEAFAKKFGGHSYYHPSTYKAALLSAGSTIDLCKAVATGQVKNGMAIVRPPGHHAMREEYCGYCYFNNVAIAAQSLLDNGTAKKILIVDWDVHHGQATQQMFYNDPKVLYFSPHRFEYGMSWPNLRESDWNWIGSGAGTGFNVNVPLNAIRMGNTEYLAIWHQILLPIAHQFQPDVVLVSAGYDAALNDPLGEMCITPQCYPHLLAPLMALAQGRVAVVLEGGYGLQGLAEGAALTLRTLLGDPCPLIAPIGNPKAEIVQTIYNVCTMLQSHWKLGLGILPDGPGKMAAAHAPKLRFDFDESKKPVEHPSRDPHPVHLHHIWSVFDKELKELIETTDLSLPEHRVGIVCTEDGSLGSPIGHQVLETVVRAGAGTQEWNGSVRQLVNHVAGRTCRSGTALVPSNADMDQLRDLVMNAQPSKRILVVNLNSDSAGVEGVLHILAGAHEMKLSFKQEFYGLVGFISRVLPVAYEFSPELVLVADNSSSGSLSSLVAHILHLLNALAYGRLALLTKWEANARAALRAVLGDQLPVLVCPNDAGAAASVQLVMDTNQWTMVNPFTEKKIPENCDIPIGDYDS